MAEIATTYRSESHEQHGTTQQTSTGTQPVITEQQVLFGTTAAVALPPAKPSRWHFMHTLGEALRDYFSPFERSATPKHYPNRHGWLENAAMGREMNRL
jgi:hypothetical protein